MDLIDALKALRRRWKWVLIGILPVTYLALSTAYHVGTTGLHKKSLQYGAATTTLLVDSPKSTIVQADGNITQLANIATVFAEFYDTTALQTRIASRLHVSPGSIAISVPNQDPNVPTTGQNVGQRNTGLLQESNSMQLLVEPQPGLPMISLYAQGPTGTAAVSLANAAAHSLDRYINSLRSLPVNQTEIARASASGVAPPARVTVRQLGPAVGGTVDPGTNKKIVALAFVGLLIVDCFIVIMLNGFVERWRRHSELEAHAAATAGAQANHAVRYQPPPANGRVKSPRPVWAPREGTSGEDSAEAPASAADDEREGSAASTEDQGATDAVQPAAAGKRRRGGWFGRGRRSASAATGSTVEQRVDHADEEFGEDAGSAESDRFVNLSDN